jgi:TRAP-type transport system periplasmic protein
LALMPLTNAKMWNGLVPADRSLMMAAFDEGGKACDAITRKLEATLLGSFKARGMEIIEPNRKSFEDAMDDMYPKFENIWGAGAWQAMKAIA